MASSLETCVLSTRAEAQAGAPLKEAEVGAASGSALSRRTGQAGTSLSRRTACQPTARDDGFTRTWACARILVFSTCCHVTLSTNFLH